MTDEALLEAARSGDKRALERLLVLEEPRIYAYGLRMCGHPEDAREVLQETMLAVARNIGAFRGDAKLTTWLFQLARSACSRQRRRERPEPVEPDAIDIADTAPDPERIASASELAAVLTRALQHLSEAQREVLVLRDIEGLSAPEVADVLGLEVGAVKSRLHRARSALAEALEHELEQPPPAPGPCPDLLARWSERREGDLDKALCAEVEQHVAGCPSCQRRCAQLDQMLLACREPIR